MPKQINQMFLYFSFLVTCVLAVGLRQVAAVDSPNIVIVLADDMGYGDPRCNNPQSKCPTPNIDALARQGMRFTDAHAAGAWCVPSRYGLMTGRYAFRAESLNTRQPVIEETTTTLAQTLRESGYQTAMVGKWHLGFIGGSSMNSDPDRMLYGGPVDRGFERFFGLHASLDIPDYFWIHDRDVPIPPTIPVADQRDRDGWWNAIQGRFWRQGLRAADFEIENVLDRIAERAEQDIELLSQKDAPFFLYVALTAPHTPWVPGEQFQEADGAGVYSQFVAHTDAVLGRIQKQLQASGNADDTIVVFSSDNGPVWYQEDSERFGHNAVGPLRGMKADIFEGGHRVPLVVSWPDHVLAGSVSEQLISFVDLHATLASLAGASAPDSAIDSLDFSEVWLGSTKQPVRQDLMTFQGPEAIRQGKWKLITKREATGGIARRDPNRNPPTPAGASGDKNTLAGHLYDLSRDIGETNNLYADHPELVGQLTNRIAEIEAMEAEWTPLFNGVDFDGWTVHSGRARFEVVDGVIVGTSVDNTPNSFLCTDRQYSDFELELEVQCDVGLNSGIQIRSRIASEPTEVTILKDPAKPRTITIPIDRVHGYQIEIAKQESGKSGGLYDEARRFVFLDEPGEKPGARGAFKDGQWNRYRIRCRGDHIQAWVNGILCADVRDEMDATGVIGLQVHGNVSVTGRRSPKPFEQHQVRFRNLKIRDLSQEKAP